MYPDGSVPVRPSQRIGTPQPEATGTSRSSTSVRFQSANHAPTLPTYSLTSRSAVMNSGNPSPKSSFICASGQSRESVRMIFRCIGRS